MLDTITMRPSEIFQYLKVMIENQTGPAHFIWGPPGIGKSAVIKQIAHDAGIGLIDIRLSLRDPSDLRGFPYPENGRAKWLVPWELPTSGRGIILLDEINLAPQLVQAAAYQLVTDKRIGEYQVPEGWGVVAAGNRIDDGAYVYKMAKPLRNRFVHIYFEVNFDDWRVWAIKNDIASEVVEFLSFRPDFLFKFDPKRSDDAFPTPRSWEFVSIIWKWSKGRISDELLFKALAGTVGLAYVTEFQSFLELRQQFPDVQAILEGKDLIPDQLDVAQAIIAALVLRARPEHYDRLVRYSEKLPQVELAVLLVGLLRVKIGFDALINCPSFPGWSRRHHEFIQEV